MFKLETLKRLSHPKLLKFSFKTMLGGILVYFLLGYQPSLPLPLIKPSVANAQAEQTATVSAQASPVHFQIPHLGYLSTPYSSYHPGVDIAFGLGAPIKAIASGTITNTGYNFFGLGLTVTVDHGHGYRSLYAHLGKIYVKKDQLLSETDYLGEVGLTGNTSGPHTHLEVYKDGSSINPLAVLPEIREYPLAEDFKPVGGTAFHGKPSLVQIPPAKVEQKEEKNTPPSVLTNVLGKEVKEIKTDPLKNLRLGL